MKEGTIDQKFTVINSDSNLAGDENLLNVKTLERCFNERIDRKMGNILDTVENRIQKANLTAYGSIFTPKLGLAFSSIDASSGQDATSFMTNSEGGEHIGITAPFGNLSDRNNTRHVFITNDETQNIFLDEVSEKSVPGTNFDRQLHTDRMVTGQRA